MALLKCPDCGRDVSDQALACPNCGRPVLTSSSSDQSIVESTNCSSADPIPIDQQPSNVPAPDSSGVPLCHLCHQPMNKKVIAPTEGAGCLLFLAGIPVFFFVPGGIAIGILMGLLGLVLLSRRKGVWRCKKCGVEISRHMKWYEM